MHAARKLSLAKNRKDMQSCLMACQTVVALCVDLKSTIPILMTKLFFPEGTTFKANKGSLRRLVDYDNSLINGSQQLPCSTTRVNTS